MTTCTEPVSTASLPPLASPLASPLAGEIELRAGLSASGIDGHLRRASRGRDISNRILAFYLDELHKSGKHRDLGYSCLAGYADKRLGMDPRRARELYRAGRALLTLTRIDTACREGELCWTKTELLTHGLAEHEQVAWLERARRVGCADLQRMLIRHRKGLHPEKSEGGGLPRSEFQIEATLSAESHDKLELVRQFLMRDRGEFVDDSDAIGWLLGQCELPTVDEAADAEREVNAEGDVTPRWLRLRVLARDEHACRCCGATGELHVHHIRFRSRGGATREDNLVATCRACHGLIHEGRLFASGPASSVQFRNRDGETLVSPRAGVSLPGGVVLSLLRGEDSEEDGGRPPLRQARGSGAGSGTSTGKTFADRVASIPDPMTGEWFKNNLDLLDCSRDGVWRLNKAVRRERERAGLAYS